MDELFHDACQHCGINPRRQTTHGRGAECDACARYRQRHGTGRPQYLIDRQVARDHRRREHPRD